MGDIFSKCVVKIREYKNLDRTKNGPLKDWEQINHTIK